MCSHRGNGQRLFHSIKSQIRSVCGRAHGTGLEESLPDRLINLHLYQDNIDFIWLTGVRDLVGIHMQESIVTKNMVNS